MYVLVTIGKPLIVQEQRVMDDDVHSSLYHSHLILLYSGISHLSESRYILTIFPIFVHNSFFFFFEMFYSVILQSHTCYFFPQTQ